MIALNLLVTACALAVVSYGESLYKVRVRIETSSEWSVLVFPKQFPSLLAATVIATETGGAAGMLEGNLSVATPTGYVQASRSLLK